MNNLYIGTGGGLGDAIRQYLKDDRNWGRLRSIKKVHPGVKIKAILCCHNPGVLDLFSHNPYIDYVENYLYEHDPWPVLAAHANGYTHIKSIDVRPYQYFAPVVYLTPEEQKLVDGIKCMGRYVVFHPFAGLENRLAIPPTEYLPLIKRIHEELRVTCIVVGARYKRSGAGGGEDKDEYLQPAQREEGIEDQSYFINLIDKINPRVMVRLIKDAAGFVGTHSSCNITAWVYQKPTVLIAPEFLVEDFKTNITCAWPIIQSAPYSRVVYSPREYYSIDQYRNVDFNKVREQAFQALKEIM